MVFKPRFRLIGIMLLVSACSILAQESPPRLAGRVTQADSGAPIEGATVSLVPPMIMGQLNFQTAKTQSNGDYRFDQVRNGAYSITVSADGFVSQDYNRDATPAGAFLRFDSSTSIQGIDFQLAHEAVIRGLVVDKDGKPVANLPVTAVGLQGNDERPGHVGAFAKTDDLGRFVLRGLPSATYLVCANGPAGYGASSTPTPPYRETWFGGATSREGAIPIGLKGGDERNDLHITVEPEMRHRVIVWPSGPEGGTAPDRYDVLIEHRSHVSMKQPNGSYVIPDIPPGHYTVVSTAWSRVQYLGQGEESFDVSGSDVTVHVHLGGLGEIAGTVKWDGAPSPSSEKALFKIESEEGAAQGVRVNAQGQFDLTEVLPGKYRFKPFPVHPVAVPRSVQCRGKEVSDDSPLQIGDREKVLDCKVTIANP